MLRGCLELHCTPPPHTKTTLASLFCYITWEFTYISLGIMENSDDVPMYKVSNSSYKRIKYMHKCQNLS